MRFIAELEYDDDLIYNEDDEEAKKWFFDILLGDDLNLVSEEMGDTIGQVKILKIVGDQPEISHTACPHGHEDWDDCPDCCH